MAGLFHIVYTSTASKEFEKGELAALLEGSVRRNKRAGITGLLLFKDGCFMQALEGEEAVAKAVFRRISADPRHHNIIPLLQEPIERREFEGFAMAFRDLGSPELRQTPGYSEFLNTPLNGDLFKQDIPKCKRLLLYFKKNIQ